ncbi:hypothetical protein [Roseivirga sp.]|uniref:hypothetical protein n=1 Tax=Roseivirga sp. TaxID=1964215 RepID=UPI003B5278BC
MRIILILLLCSNLLKAQVFQAGIEKFELTDSALRSSIETVIKMEEKKDSLFANGKGYLIISVDESIREGDRSSGLGLDTLVTYQINISFAHPEEDINDLMMLYPTHYSQVNGRVLAYQTGNRIFSFTPEGKQAYLEDLKGNLEPFPAESLRKTWNLKGFYLIHILENRVSQETAPPAIEYRTYKQN